MITVENQDNYKDAPLVISYKNVANPIDVLTGLIEQGQKVVQTGRTAVDAISGEPVNTNIGGYDLQIQKGQEENKKIWGIPKPIFILSAVTIGAITIFAVVSSVRKKKTA
jgi:hypothetical protein